MSYATTGAERRDVERVAEPGAVDGGVGGGERRRDAARDSLVPGSGIAGDLFARNMIAT